MADLSISSETIQGSNIGLIEEVKNPQLEKLEQRVNDAAKSAFKHVNIGFEVLQLGLKRAAIYVNEITGHANEAKDIQALLKKPSI